MTKIRTQLKEQTESKVKIMTTKTEKIPSNNRKIIIELQLCHRNYTLCELSSFSG